MEAMKAQGIGAINKDNLTDPASSPDPVASTEIELVDQVIQEGPETTKTDHRSARRSDTPWNTLQPVTTTVQEIDTGKRVAMTMFCLPPTTGGQFQLA